MISVCLGWKMKRDNLKKKQSKWKILRYRRGRRKAGEECMGDREEKGRKDKLEAWRLREIEREKRRWSERVINRKEKESGREGPTD